MNRTTYRQIWSLHEKGTSLKASIETIQAITLSRDEATPWLVKFMEDYAHEQGNIYLNKSDKEDKVSRPSD